MLTAFRSLTLLGWLALLAFAAFVALALLASPARADDGAEAAMLAALVGPALAVWGVVLLARSALPAVFWPGDADRPWTPQRAKLACMLLAVVVGLGLGALGVAPDVGGAGLPGRLVGGFLAACLATFGRDLLSRSAGAVRGQA